VISRTSAFEHVIIGGFYNGGNVEKYIKRVEGRSRDRWWRKFCSRFVGHASRETRR